MNLKYNSRSTLLAMCLLSMTSSSAHAFTAFSSHHSYSYSSTNSFAPLSSTTSKATEDAFSAFAESLDEDDLFNDNSNGKSNGFGSNDDIYSESTWQESVEKFLDPTIPLAKRQILLTDLLNSNDNIREDILLAVKERKIDNLLTPTGKKLQDGTRAVARQITTDILPSLTELASKSATNGSPKSLLNNDLLPTLVPKIGSTIFDAVQNQAKKTIETISEDLANPANIPQRISKQTASFATEARNMFLETPEGLVGPKYNVVSTAQGYEIREYEGYKVASASMSKVGETYSLDDITKSGTAFNTLAAYLFGGNDEGKVMDMTTPVSTTSLGEMRFYLTNNGSGSMDELFPEPLSPSKEVNEQGAVKIVDVPPARLAVAQFPGFVTEGEVSRQKDALLSSLSLDGVEVDTPHGIKIPHIVFQYNPPYTIPIVRRNEIAIPVRSEEDFVDETNINLESKWKDNGSSDDSNNDEDDDGAGAPSDVE